LIDEIIRLNYGPNNPVPSTIIRVDQIVAEIVSGLERAGLEKIHSYRVMKDVTQGVRYDIYWHEDLDECQAYDIKDLEGDCQYVIPIVAINLYGKRGALRTRILGIIRTALTNLGLYVRHQGITWQ
jgi:hypothetical protein